MDFGAGQTLKLCAIQEDESTRIGHTGLTKRFWHRPYSIASCVGRRKVRVARLYTFSVHFTFNSYSDLIRVNVGKVVRLDGVRLATLVSHLTSRYQ